MQLVSRAPAEPRLRGLVRSLWHCRAPQATGREHMLPTGQMQLIVNLGADALRHANTAGGELTVGSGTLIQGMQSRSVVLDRADQRDVLGVVFEPGAGRVLLGMPLDALADAHVELADVVQDPAGLREQLVGAATPAELFGRLERWLCARIRGEADPMIRAVLGIMRCGEHSVAALASRVGSSERGLRRRFRAEVGLAPKQMSRVLRLQRALHGLRGDGSLADVALSSGFHDQAHLSHELRAVAGMTPSEYRRRGPLHRNHLG